jgi:hypothetical protein
MAIRADQKIPVGFEKIPDAACRTCGETYLIVHDRIVPDLNDAADCKDGAEDAITGEHIDEKFRQHFDSYELD